MRELKTAPASFQVIKGDVSPLTAEQRELVTMFIEHLRGLPILDNSATKSRDAAWADSNNHNPIYQILHSHFRRGRYGQSLGRGTEIWRTLSQEDTDKFHHLMNNAGTPPDPRRERIQERRRELLRLARLKLRVRDTAQEYDEFRKELGLERDASIAPAVPPVGLEVATEATWGAVR